MAQSFLKAPTIERLPNLLEQLRIGEIRIPPFQRDFVWKGDQRLELLDTIRKGLPSGSLMVWRTTRRLTSVNPVGPFSLKLPEVTEGLQTYLLDGMQRMTTLLAALGAGLFTREGQVPPGQSGREAPDETPWEAAFDVSTSEGGFELMSAADAEAEGSRLLPLAVLLDDTRFDEWRDQVKPTRDETNRARALRSAFVDYQIPVVPLATDEIGPVTLTFKRLNQGGTRMGDFHMARALSFADDFDLELSLDEAVLPLLTPIGWEGVDRDDLLKVVAVAYGFEPVEVNSESLAKKISSRPGRMVDVGAAACWSVNLLAELGFGGPAVLPSAYLLVFAARAHLELDGQVSESRREKLRTWLAEAAISERFSGGTATHIIIAGWRELARSIGIKVAARDVGRKAKPKKIRPPGGQVNFGWARPKVTAAVMALQAPRESDGAEMETPVRQLGERGKDVFHPIFEGVEARGLDRDLILGTSNRLVCSSEALGALRAVLRTSECTPEVLASHLITPEAHACLLAGDYFGFLRRRLQRIRTAEQEWLVGHGSNLPVPPLPIRLI